MLKSLTVEVAKELIESSKNEYVEAHGRFFARLLLSCPAGLNLEEAGSVFSSVLSGVATANEIIGYFEAISHWKDELQEFPGLVARLESIHKDAAVKIDRSETMLFRVIDGMRLSDEDRSVVLERMETFKEASKKLGYAEVAEMFAASQQK